MSAICGAVGLDGQPFTHQDLTGMLAVLDPFGSRERFQWCGEAGRCGVAVASVMQRRREGQSASRPAMAAGGDLVFVGDIRLDNREVLSAVLGCSPSTCDDRLILTAYERWGSAFLDRLVGSYAFAIVDRRRGGVLLGRDHVGDRPIVLHQRLHIVAFASNALAMTGFTGVGHNLDERKAAQILSLSYGTDRTLVAGVRWLPAGHAMWIDAAGARFWRWWAVDPSRVVDLGSVEAHAGNLRVAFDTAVRACLRGAERIGAEVSGGLDSTSVAATAAGMVRGEELPTYTAVPPLGWSGPVVPNRDDDESPLVSDLVDFKPNLSPRWVQARAGGFFDRTEALWEMGAGPPLNACNMLWTSAIDDHAVADGVDVLLGGACGNLAFSADGPDWLVALARAGRPLAVARAARAWSSGTGSRLSSVLGAFLAGPLAPRELHRARRKLRGILDPTSAWLTAAALRPNLIELAELSVIHPEFDKGHVDERLLLWNQIDGVAGQADTNAAIDLVSGIMHRNPTADRRVFEVAASQPEWVRRADGHSRAVVRTAMAGRLPDSILWRQRRGAQLPEWLDRVTSARVELAEDVAAMHDHPTSRDLIDVDRLTALVDAWPHSSRAAEPRVVRDYRYALLRGVAVSRYLRWFEERAHSTRLDSKPAKPFAGGPECR